MILGESSSCPTSPEGFVIGAHPGEGPAFPKSTPNWEQREGFHTSVRTCYLSCQRRVLLPFVQAGLGSGAPNVRLLHLKPAFRVQHQAGNLTQKPFPGSAGTVLPGAQLCRAQLVRRSCPVGGHFFLPAAGDRCVP